jgi:hypothetical protein
MCSTPYRIAWQKRSKTRYFDDPQVLQAGGAVPTLSYKPVVLCLPCSSSAIAMALHRKLVTWLWQRDEPRAAAWFEECWTRERGNYMLAHGEVGGTNNNCSTEGNWGGVKKAVCGTAGSTCCLAVRSVVPSLVRFLVDKRKEQASYRKADTKERATASRAKSTFTSLPQPIKEDWNHLESLRPIILEICTVFARPDVKIAWEVHIQDIVQVAEEDGVAFPDCCADMPPSSLDKTCILSAVGDMK